MAARVAFGLVAAALRVCSDTVGTIPNAPLEVAAAPAEDTSTCSAGGDVSGSDHTGSSACGCGSLKRGDFFAMAGTAQNAEHSTAGVDSSGEDLETASIIYLDGGKFRMGMIKDDEGDTAIHPADGEMPTKIVTVAPFGLGAFEVSNKRFELFVNQTGYVTESERFGWSFAVEPFISPAVNATVTQQVQNAPWWLPVKKADWRRPHGFDTGIEHLMDHPVVHVSLADGETFCRWSRPGGRLPTEAEWEFAARSHKKNRRFPWGNRVLTGQKGDKHRMNIWQSEVDHKLVKDGKVLHLYHYEGGLQLVKEYYSAPNSAADGYRGTAPVNAFGPQNELGFHNMVGNVWEWTSTKWVAVDPKAPPVEPNTMVKKGGSFMCNRATCYRYRTSARMLFTADSAAANVGFRCAYDVAANLTLASA